MRLPVPDGLGPPRKPAGWLDDDSTVRLPTNRLELPRSEFVECSTLKVGHGASPS